MSGGLPVSLEQLSSGLYIYKLTVARSAAVENFVDMMHRFLNSDTATEPIYLLLDASSLEIAYTPRFRERLEAVFTQIHQHPQMIRIALVLPHTMGSCTVFLNNLLRSRETPQIRHTCFASRQDAQTWLEGLQRSESLPAVQGF
jgi:hypothetical protein